MGLHIEIGGEMTRREWEAVASIAAVMLGTTSLTPVADPLPAGPSVAVVTVPPPVAPADVAEAMMAAEEQRVAAVAASTPAGASPAPPHPAGVDLDANGLPWDARIHASTKAKKNDGVWKYSRGCDKELIKQVEAELRQVMAAPVPPVGDAPPPPPVDPAAAFGAAPPPPPVDDTPAPPPPPVEETPTPPAPEPAGDLTAFANVMRTVASKQAGGTLAAETVTAIIGQLGLTSVRDLAKRPDLIPAFEALLP